MREFLKSGYANPEDGWTEETAAQHDLARAIVVDVARRYAERQISLVIDDAIFPSWEAVGEEPWRKALRGLPYTLVVLLPSFEAVRERNRLRDGRRCLGDDALRLVYDDMRAWRDGDVLVIDNTELTVAETVEALVRSLDERR